VSGAGAAWLFLTGWVIEYSLSVDNIFVIALIFRFFGVPGLYQHRVLFWGIMGALLLRGVMIWIGAAVIAEWRWLLYVFGGILVLTAARLIFASDKEARPDQNPLVRLARLFFPVSQSYDGQKFFTRLESGKLAMTPLFLVLLVVESTDVVFAVDSIPAIFAITLDPFLVFTSNVFAILGLRSLYFALAGLMDQFRYLKYSLAFILGFIGVKMILMPWVHLEPYQSLPVIVISLAVGIVASIRASRHEAAAARGAPPAHETQGPAA
jgi:tellurite resistance protein TerC